MIGAALLGTATGMRSSLGIASAAQSLPNFWVRRGVLLLVGGELAADKAEKTPSRLETPGIVSRVVGGGLGGGALAQRTGRPIPLNAVVGAATAVGSSFGGARWRAWSADRFGSDRPGALIEDAVAVLLALAAARV